MEIIRLGVVLEVGVGGIGGYVLLEVRVFELLRRVV